MTDFVDLLAPDYLLGYRDRQRGPVDAVPTPFPTWNSSSGGDGGGEGLARRWLVTIGGNPKQGKTLLSLALTLEALRHGEKVGFMSLEMSDPELATRFYAMLGQVPVKKLQKGKHWAEDALAAVDTARAKLGVPLGYLPQLFVNSEPIYQLESLTEHMRALYEAAAVRYYVVDFLQLIGMADDDESVKVCTRAMKELRRFAKDHDSTVVVLSQYKRSVSEDYTQSPTPQSLFGGGSVDQLSDQILLLDHSLYEYDAAKKVARTWLKLTNRHGQHGDIPVLWDYSNLTVREGTPDEERDWPTRKKSARTRS